MVNFFKGQVLVRRSLPFDIQIYICIIILAEKTVLAKINHTSIKQNKTSALCSVGATHCMVHNIGFWFMFQYFTDHQRMV